jgi:hypothetical protein
MRRVPLRERKFDFVFLAFLVINATVVTYIIDVEQLIIRDPANFTYPVWPPAFFVDLIHWWGETYDPLLLARPPFWRMTIWIDVIFFGPFYLFAIYAFIRGRDWIRVPALVWSGTMMANVLIILMDEYSGVTPAKNFLVVLGANATWLLMPFLMIWRMRRDQPFHEPLPPMPEDSTTPPAQPPAAAVAA